jgi:Trp operon repressor
MAQISRKPLRKEIYEQVFELLIRIFTDSYSRKDAANLLDDLLSPTEKIVLAKRLAIALLLAKDYGYEEIKEILHVSMPTIAE